MAGENWWENIERPESRGFFEDVARDSGAFNDYDFSQAAVSRQEQIKALVAGYMPERENFNLPNYNLHVANARTLQAKAGKTLAPQFGGATIDPTQQAQVRGQQMDLAAMLQQQAMGQGPSLAQGQLQQATDRNMAQAMAMAQSQRGMGASSALRQVGNQRAQMGQQAAMDSGLLRAQEQLGAQNTLGQLLTGMRGQDVGLATGQAQLAQQAGLSNQDATLRQRQLNGQLENSYATMGLNIDQLKMGGRQAYENMMQQRYAYDKGLAVQQEKNNQQMVGSTLAAVGGMAAMAASDERVKTDVKPAEKKLDDFLDALGSHEYRYKDGERFGKGQRVSPMAQEFEKSELGRNFIKEAEDGTKLVDYGAGFGTLSSALAHLQKKVKRLELGKGGES